MTKLDRKVLIETAFKKLLITEEKDELLAIAIDRLANIDVASLGTAPPQFTKIGSVRTKKELTRLARKNSNIEKCLKELHEPAILALANHGSCRDPNVPPDTVRRIAKKLLLILRLRRRISRQEEHKIIW